MTPPAGPPDESDAALAGWIEQNVAGEGAGIVLETISGGLSNLTLAATAADGRRWIVRRPPDGPLLPSAHDVAREFRIMAALGPTAVPVPSTVAVCDDLSVIGVPFTVVDNVDGIVVRDEAEANVLPAAVRAATGPALAAALAEIHRVDPEAMGLGDVARAVAYLPRQLDRWSRQWQATAVGPDEDLTAAHAWLVDRLPAERQVTLVHGDFRLDNCIVGPDGQVRAVLDWELAALGDPLADLATFLVSWAEPADTVRALTTSPTAAGGFATRARVVECYAEAADRELADLDYYVVFVLWRLACIFEGVRSRHEHGAMGEAGRADAARFADHARALGRAAWEATAAPEGWVGREVVAG